MHSCVVTADTVLLSMDGEVVVQSAAGRRCFKAYATKVLGDIRLESGNVASFSQVFRRKGFQTSIGLADPGEYAAVTDAGWIEYPKPYYETRDAATVSVQVMVEVGVHKKAEFSLPRGTYTGGTVIRGISQ